MKNIYTFILLSCISLLCFAQAGEWTWMHGPNSPGSNGTFGTQGTANAANDPPALYEPAEWRDNSGRLWLYGGRDTSSNFRNDLWMYDPGTNMWTWMKGTKAFNDAGNYGVQGT